MDSAPGYPQDVEELTEDAHPSKVPPTYYNAITAAYGPAGYS